jgi:hypothetical protein
MWRQRYSNEALYPYNGPVVVKRHPNSGKRKEKKLMKRRPMQLEMQFN